MKYYRHKSLAAVICLMTLLTLGAATNALGLLIEDIDLSSFPQVKVSMSAWNSEGLPLADLGRDNFQIQENDGVAFKADNVRVDKDAPLSVALVLDISGSMLGQPITDARVAAARFLDRLSPADQAALIAFSDNLEPDPLILNPDHELGFSANLSPMYDMVEGLTAQGGTHLYNAVFKAVALTQALPAGHRAVLVLSDGVNEPANIGDPNAAINLAKENRLPIYVIGLGNKIDEPYLRKLASETGGVFRLAPNSAELAQTFDDMAELLKTQYTLVYTSQALTVGANTLDLTIILKALGAEVSQKLVLADLPVLPTSTPEPLPTPTPVPPTAAPTKITSPVVVETPQPPQGLLGIILSIPGYLWLVSAGVLMMAITLFIRALRRSRVFVKCAKCGFVLDHVEGPCPQCGETKRISVRMNSNKGY